MCVSAGYYVIDVDARRGSLGLGRISSEESFNEYPLVM